jgi:hypothetical protein
MISIITTGRDDNYGQDFIIRLKKSLESNITFLEKNNIEYEYIAVEWNPVKGYLCDNQDLHKLFDNKNLKNIIVSNSVSKKENLSETIHFEYFAKNVGVRNSKFENILLLNSDIVLPESTFQKIVDLCTGGLCDNKFYRARYREQVNMDLSRIVLEDCHYPNNPDAVICGYCSGDFLLMKKNTFCNVAKGYDETNPSHRTISQTGMDGEILWNLHKKGVSLEFIDDVYSHINHGKPNPYDGEYNMYGYDNKEDWGFIKYNKKYISENKIIIE